MKRKAKFLRGIKKRSVVVKKMSLTFLTTTIPKSEAVKQMMERMHRISNEMGVPVIIPTFSSQADDRLVRSAITGLAITPIICPPCEPPKTMAIRILKTRMAEELVRKMEQSVNNLRIVQVDFAEVEKTALGQIARRRYTHG